LPFHLKRVGRVLPFFGTGRLLFCYLRPHVIGVKNQLVAVVLADILGDAITPLAKGTSAQKYNGP
jgi:hypothetical protein